MALTACQERIILHGRRAGSGEAPPREPEPKMTVSNQRLRELREAAGMTQEALARAPDLSLLPLRELERGGMDPSWSTVQRLAKTLGLSTDALADSVTNQDADARKLRRRRKT